MKISALAISLALACASAAHAQIFGSGASGGGSYTDGQALAAVAAAGYAPSMDLGTFTVATLPGVTGTTNACSSVNAKKTAWASDLHGLAAGDRVICDGVSWKSVRPLVVAQAATANMTIMPMTMAPTVVVTGTLGLGVTNTVTLGTSFVYGGYHQRVVRKVTGLGTLTVAAAGLSLNLPLGTIGSWADFDYDAITCQCWIETAQGTL